MFAFGHCQVIITSYQLLSSMIDEYVSVNSVDSDNKVNVKNTWDYIILDEGNVNILALITCNRP